MLLFPQLSSGATTQYPLTRQLSQRSIQSSMEDGTILSLPDIAASYLAWKVAFRDLSDQEAVALRSFFVAAQGNLQPFVFLDPTANLLVWSEDFSKAAWQTAGLAFDSSVADPFGTHRAARAHNSTAGLLTIAQQTQIPGEAETCLSVYLRSATPASITLTRSAGSHSQTIQASVTSSWQRFYLSTVFAAVTDASLFTIGLPAGTVTELFGPQVDSQVNPSEYVMTTTQAGVYSSARFDMSQLDVVATAPNRNACMVSIRSNLPSGEL
jgi:hypothetical protein